MRSVALEEAIYFECVGFVFVGCLVLSEVARVLDDAVIAAVSVSGIQFALVGNVVYFRDARVGNVKVPPLEDGVVGEQGVADDWTFPSLDCFNQ